MFEGGEEWLQTSLDGYYRNLALMEEKEINLISEDAIYQGLVAAVTVGLLNINRGETYFGYSMRNKDANYSNYEKV